MTREEIFARLDDESALALTMWAEARGDRRDGSSVEERIAVGCVVRNRARVNNKSLKFECLRPRQFSCWNEGDDKNHLDLMAQAEALLLGEVIDPLLHETLFLAGGIAHGVLRDPTSGATHYFAPASMVPPGARPRWAEGQTPVARIGSQVFFKLA